MDEKEQTNKKKEAAFRQRNEVGYNKNKEEKAMMVVMTVRMEIDSYLEKNDDE